jgi:AraC family transcriptional regulator
VQEGTVPDYEVVLKPVPPQMVAGIRSGTLPEDGRIQALFDELEAYLKVRDVTVDETMPFMGIYYEAENQADDLAVEAAVPINQKLAASGPVTIHTLDGVETMAYAIHHGPLEGLSKAYNALLHWIDSCGYEVNGPNRDLYFLQTQAQKTAERGHTVTEVQFPVKKRPFLLAINQDKEHKLMEPQIVHLPAFDVVGLLYQGKNENNDITQLWDKFLPRVEEIKHTAPDAFGICGAVEEDGSFSYLAGFQVSDMGEVPEGMKHWLVPEQTYAVFPCTLQNIPETFNHAYKNWLPQSDYQSSSGVDLEFYPPEFDAAVGTGMFVYIPVKASND